MKRLLSALLGALAVAAIAFASPAFAQSKGKIYYMVPTLIDEFQTESVKAIEKFLTQMPRRFEVASGPAIFCAVLVELDGCLGKALRIERFRLNE